MYLIFKVCKLPSPNKNFIKEKNIIFNFSIQENKIVKTIFPKALRYNANKLYL